MPAPRVLQRPFTTLTRCLLVPPAEPEPSARPPLLVLLHGQGQSGERQLRWMGPGAPAHFAVASPDGFHAHEVRTPDRPIRIGHAWYLYTGDQAAFAESLAESERALWALVDAALAELGADPARVYLCGFSQGAYLAHCAAVRAAGRVAGWIAQSGRLKTEFLLAELPAVAGKPVLLQHGRADPSLPLGAAEASERALAEHGARVSLELHDGGHEITPAMAARVKAWLSECEPRR